MKVFVANPPFIEHFNRQVRWSAKTSGGLHPPIYLAYAAAVLKEAGHDVKLEDAVALNRTTEDFLKDIRKFRPKLVVMETSTPSIVNDSRIAARVKGMLPNTKIAFTGSHCSALPERTLRESVADFVCIGEYDYTLRDLACALENKGSLKNVDGIAYLKGKRFVRTRPRALIKNIDELPWPLREQLPNDVYSDTLMTSPLTFIVTSRGCPYRCTYCNWPSTMFGHMIRRRDPVDVVDEVEHCVKKYRLKSFKFFDDTFTVNKEHVKKICNLLIKRKIKTPWICNARVDTLDEDTMRLMKKAGCRLMKIGVESGNQKILDWVKKGTTIPQIKAFFRLARKVGIQTFGSFMIGYPQETDKTIRQTFRLAKEIKPDMAQFVILQPLPGTELYRWMESRGMIPKKVKWDKYITDEGYVDLVFKHPKYTQDELRKICSKLWSSYYLRPGYVAKRIIRGMTSKREIKRNISGVKKIFRYRRT